MWADRTLPLAAFAGSLALAGLGLGLVVKRERAERRSALATSAALAAYRASQRAARVDERLSALESASRAARAEA